MSGDDVVVHCMAGRHRGGTTAVMCQRVLRRHKRHILQRREIEVSQAMRSYRKMMAEWVRDVGARTRLPRLHLIPLTYLATESSNLHVEQAGSAPLPTCTRWRSRSSALQPAKDNGQARSSRMGATHLCVLLANGEHQALAGHLSMLCTSYVLPTGRASGSEGQGLQFISFWHSQYA